MTHSEPTFLARPRGPFPDRLSEGELLDFAEDGFLIFRAFLSAEEVEHVATMLRRTVDAFWSGARCGSGEFEVASQLIAEGPLVSIKRRGTAAQVQFEPSFDPLAAETREQPRVRKVQGLEECAPWFEDCEFKPRMRRMAEQLIGVDPILFDEMALLKPAYGGMAMPLHQDNAYLTFCPPESVIAFWIAIDPARPDNGCMRLVRGGHKLGPAAHNLPDPSLPKDANATGTVVVADGILESYRVAPGAEVFAELDPGDVLIFHSMVPHGTLRNDSALNRFALQYHFRSRDSRTLSPREYARTYPGFFGGLTARAEPRK